jgi:IS5 family transposase
MGDKPLTAAEARARMLAKKARKPPLPLRKANAERTAKADRRARAYIERWMDGETHQQIADSEGLHLTTVTLAIERYRRRHPDAGIPKRKSPTKRTGG